MDLALGRMDDWVSSPLEQGSNYGFLCWVPQYSHFWEPKAVGQAQDTWQHGRRDGGTCLAIPRGLHAIMKERRGFLKGKLRFY